MQHTTQTKLVCLRPEFVISEDDIKYLYSLPENFPDTKLTASQKHHVRDIYQRYIIDNNVTLTLGKELYEGEFLDKWPSTGKKPTELQAKRMILSYLLGVNESYNNMTQETATYCFFKALTAKKTYQILISKIYHIQYI